MLSEIFGLSDERSEDEEESSRSAASARDVDDEEEDAGSVEPLNSDPAAPALVVVADDMESKSGARGEAEEHGAVTAPAPQSRTRRPAQRYFLPSTASTIRCYSCGKPGHISVNCEEEGLRPCWICGIPAHESSKCPHERCFKCLSTSHMAKDCKSRRTTIRLCYRCGSSSHNGQDCTGALTSEALTNLRCYVCGQLGHVNCQGKGKGRDSQSVPRDRDRRMFCCACGQEGHLFLTCSARSDGGYGAGAAASNFTCFNCNEVGHMARDCPQYASGRGGHASRGYYQGSGYGSGYGSSTRQRYTGSRGSSASGGGSYSNSRYANGPRPGSGPSSQYRKRKREDSGDQESASRSAKRKR